MTNAVVATQGVASARKLLVDWANGQDGWVRQLVGEVLSSRQVPSDDVVDAAFQRFLAEKRLIDEEIAAFPPLELEEAATTEATEFVIQTLSDVSGVNALAANQTIDFSRGLTILFGENGAGKTGYTRILKQLAAVRTAETILPNIHDSAAATEPRAKITYASAGQIEELDWQGETGLSPFTYVAIFDPPAVSLHVDDELAYVYTPTDLALFPQVNEAICFIRERLEAEIGKRRPPANPYLALFTRGTPVYTVIETLGAATDVAALDELAAVTDEEAAQLEGLRAQVDALKGTAVSAQLAVTKTRRDFYRDLETAARIASTFDRDSYNQFLETASAARADYAGIRSELFASAGLSGEGDSSWQEFILSAEAYREHVGQDDYPHAGDVCLYCRQPLSPEALILLQRYREFANDAARQRATEADQAAANAARQLMAVTTTTLITAVAGQRTDGTRDKVIDQAQQLLDAIEQAQDSIREHQPIAVDGLTTLAAAVEQEARKRKEATEELITDLSAKADERKIALDKAEAGYDALKDRVALRGRIAQIREYVENAKWAQRAEQLNRRFTQLLRSLTEVSKIASEQLLNSDFSERFARECEALRAPEVTLDFPGRQGQSARRKMTASYRPSAVLSEGEQKVIALADFLAESALRLTSAPLVFDDPVNSLDYRRIREVASRVAELAGDRQVIVFTHNIWFATELLSRFEKSPDRCAYYTISDESGKGVIVPGTHPRWDTVKKTASKINSIISNAQSSEGETREALVESAYSWIRVWCEVVVEMELLGGVTQRYQPNVMMTALAKIKGQHLEKAVSQILPTFEKACRIMEGHSQPLETLAIRPTLDGLQEDWQKLQDSRKAYLDAA